MNNMNASDNPIFGCLTEAEQDMCKRYIELGNNADFVKKGIAFCHGNPAHGILLTGINPGGGEGVVYYTLKDAINPPKGKPLQYWNHKKNQFVGDDDIWLLDNTAYLDLFPYFESSQDDFEKAVHPHIDFQVKVLEITQKNIEEHIQPRLIIAANKTAAYYWGFRPETTWLGYDFIKVVDVPECLRNTRIELYQINPANGFRKDTDRVGQDKYLTSNIKGAYFIPYAMYNDLHYKTSPDKILSPELVKKILEWIYEQ